MVRDSPPPPPRPRQLHIYKGRHLVLTMEDQPGILMSTATPPPGGAPPHAFVNARAYDPFSEHELGGLLRRATSFDHFLRLLIEAGYNATSNDNSPPVELGQAFRMMDGQEPVGAVWLGGGRYTNVWDHSPTKTTMEQLTVSVYDVERAGIALALLKSSASFDELKDRLEERGLNVVPVDEYVV